MTEAKLPSRSNGHRNRCGAKSALAIMVVCSSITTGCTLLDNERHRLEQGEEMSKKDVDEAPENENTATHLDKETMNALFRRQVQRLEDIVARPMDDETKVMFRKELDLLLRYLDVQNVDADRSYLKLLERRLGRLRGERAGVFISSPKAYEALMNRLAEEEKQIVGEIQRVRARLTRK